MNLPIGALLASHGYPTLDLAYFGESGLRELPVSLEYFATALRWLGRRPGVNPSREWVMGSSMGSEAALLLGVHYPKIVHGVVALSPNNLAEGSTWTFGGKAVPDMEQIPVAKIRGPVSWTVERTTLRGRHATKPGQSWPS
jgi:pimeloyl-ACP methyl ester carboxylesterase